MTTHHDTAPPRRSFRYHVGDRVYIVQGPDRGRTGAVISINPASVRPYLVKFNESWYIHFAEDRLTLAPHGWPSRQHDAADSAGARRL